MCQNSSHEHYKTCHCPGGKTERYLQPSLLLILSEKSSYGYELIERIIQLGFIDGSIDPGMIYRHLRGLEERGCVSSRWDTTGTGPAKRYYEITKDGKELLQSWIPFMEKNMKNLENFLKLYKKTLKEGGEK